MHQHFKIITFALAVVAAVFFVSQFAFAQFSNYKTFEKLATEDPEKLAEMVANSRAMSYYLTGSVVADTDEVNGNSYNWRKQGTATINGMPQMFEFGLSSEDRCTDSSDPEDLEPLLMEHWYEYNASWGGVIHRDTLACSSIQYGTVCRAGTCVPVSVPPKPRIDRKVSACKEWLLGSCICADNYVSTYNEEDGVRCEQTEYIRFAYNALTGNWDEYVKSSNWYRVEGKWPPEWIYDDEDPEDFSEAAKAYQTASEPYKQEKSERFNEVSECVRGLERNFKSVFESCFRQIGPGQKYEKYTTCVGATSNSAYRAAALACGKELLNLSPTISNQPDDSSLVDQPANATLDQLAKFRIGVEQDAERIINRKQCAGSSLPSQNPCVAEKLEVYYVDQNIDVTSAGIYFGPKVNASTVLLFGSAEQNFVTFSSAVDQLGPNATPTQIELARLQDWLARIEAKEAPLDAGYLPPQAKNPLTYMEFAPGTEISIKNLVVLDADPGAEVKQLYEPQMPVVGEWKPLQKDSEVPFGSLIVTDQNSILVGNKNVIVEISPLSGVVVSGSNGSDTQAAGSDFVPFINSTDGSSQVDDALIWDVKFGGVTVENVGTDSDVEVRTPLTITKSKHTKFLVAYDPEQKVSATTIYEGEVEVTDRFTGETTILKPADNGQPSTLIVPLARAAESDFAIDGSRSTRNGWVWFIILILLAGGGFWLYKKGILKRIMLPK